MPQSKKRTGRGVDPLTLLAGLVLGLDSIFGLLIAAGTVDTYQPVQVMWALTLVTGFPMYLLDLWLNTRLAVALLALLIFRSMAAYLVNPGIAANWRLSALLFTGFLLVQTSRLLRRPPSAGET